VRDKCYDRRHIEFSKALGCEAELVEKVFLQSGVDDVPSRQEAQELGASILQYAKAEKSIDKAIHALEGLSDIERAAHQILNADLVGPLRSVLQEVVSWKALAIQRKANFKATGPSNENANKLAEFVAVMFEVLGKKVTFGIQTDSTEPSTEFGVMVKHAFEIYGIRQPLKVEDVYSPLGGGRWKRTQVEAEGELISWRRPAQNAFNKRQS